MVERFKILTHLRNDLERVRMLSELVRKREKEKLRMMHLQMEYLYMAMTPLTCAIRRIHDHLMKYVFFRSFIFNCA
jgi:NuA3 HAT complex component NTO1